MRVPFDYTRQENMSLLPRLLPVIRGQLETGTLVGGAEVVQLEHQLAAQQGLGQAIATRSGTDALRLTIRALAPPPGSRVVTVANCFAGTVAAIIAEGLRPALIDVGQDENLDVSALEPALTADTSLVVGVHLRGLPARVDVVRDRCAGRGIALVEDCTEALGATLFDQPVGTFGVAGWAALCPRSILGACGAAGVAITDDPDLATQIRRLRDRQPTGSPVAALPVGDTRLDAIQAAVLNAKIRYVDEWTDRRRELAALYDELLADLPATGPGRHVYHRYAIRTPRRDALQAHLREHGVASAIHYPVPVHRNPAWDRVAIGPGGLPATEANAQRTLSLPVHPMMTEAHVRYVAECVENFYYGPG